MSVLAMSWHFFRHSFVVVVDGFQGHAYVFLIAAASSHLYHSYSYRSALGSYVGAFSGSLYFAQGTNVIVILFLLPTTPPPPLPHVDLLVIRCIFLCVKLHSNFIQQ